MDGCSRYHQPGPRAIGSTSLSTGAVNLGVLLVWGGTAHPANVLDLDLIELHIPSWDEGQLDVTSEFKLGWLDPARSWTRSLISFACTSLGKLCYPLKKNSSLSREWLACIQGPSSSCCELLCTTKIPLLSLRGGGGLCMCPTSGCSLCPADTARTFNSCCRFGTGLDVCPSLDGDHQLICSGAMCCKRLTAIWVSTRQYLSLERSNLLHPPLPSSTASAFLV